MIGRLPFTPINTALLALMFAIGHAGGSQAGESIVDGRVGGFQEAFALSSTGNIYIGSLNPQFPWSLYRSVPISSPAVALEIVAGVSGTPHFIVFTQDGTVYDCDYQSGPCVAVNVFSGRTPAGRTSWGGLKLHYR